MWFRLAEFVMRTGLVLGVTCLLLVPTGMCVCAAHDVSAPAEDHQPGCPEVRKLDRAGPVAHYAGDPTSASAPAAGNDDPASGPPRVVRRASHGPPRGHPLYLTLQTLLI